MPTEFMNGMKIGTRITLIEARLTAVENKLTPNTARLTTGQIIQIAFGLAVFGATLYGKISWPEAFAILKTVVR